MNEEKIAEAIELLQKDLTKNCNLVNFIEQNEISSVDIINENVLVRGISDKNWVYFSAKNSEGFNSLISKLNSDDNYFAVVEEEFIPLLSSCIHIETELCALKLFFPDSTLINSPVNHTIQPLTISDARFIYNHSDYKHFLTIDYIRDRITKDIGFCCRDEGIPVSWILTHDDGAIGNLYTLPEFRKRGYAEVLLRHITDSRIRQDKLPFVHIEENNTPSLSLVTKLGFCRYKKVAWCRRV